MLMEKVKNNDNAILYYANEVFRSTYNLGFLGVTDPILELELESRRVARISRFLVE